MYVQICFLFKYLNNIVQPNLHKTRNADKNMMFQNFSENNNMNLEFKMLLRLKNNFLIV